MFRKPQTDMEYPPPLPHTVAARAFSPVRGQAISHVLRLTEPHERLALLNITISTLPSMYVRGFKRTATNIVDYYEAMGDDCPDPDLRSMVRGRKEGGVAKASTIARVCDGGLSFSLKIVCRKPVVSATTPSLDKAALNAPSSLSCFFFKVLEIGENLKVLMSEARMAVLTQEIDEWAAKKAEEDSMEVR